MDEEYNDETDMTDTQQEYQEALLDSVEANYPTQKEQMGLYQTLWKMIQRKDSTKIANLQKQEIGDSLISVRDAQRLSMLGYEFNNPAYSTWFGQHAEITLATSMSRDGWLGDLFISQKKSTTRAKKSSSPLTTEKWKLFNKKEPSP